MQKFSKLGGLFSSVVRVLSLSFSLAGRPCAGHIVLVLVIFVESSASLVNPRNEQGSLILLVRKLRQKVLICGLVKSPMKLILVNI